MTTLPGEIIMTGRPIGGLASPTPFMAGAAHRDGTLSTASPLIGDLTGETRAEMMNLQKLICELLLKNQQLRMALSVATRKPEDALAQTE